jgi:hypothetical protein
MKTAMARFSFLFLKQKDVGTRSLNKGSAYELICRKQIGEHDSIMQRGICPSDLKVIKLC